MAVRPANGEGISFIREIDFRAPRTLVVQGDQPERQRLLRAVRHTAALFAMPRCARRLEEVYQQVFSRKTARRPHDDTEWAALLRLINEQWNILNGVAAAVSDSLFAAESRRETTR